MKLAWDTETKGFAWYDGETAFLASWADERNEYLANVLTPEGAQETENALRSASLLVAHNASFDTHQTRETIGLDLLGLDTTIDDTDLMARTAIPTGQGRGSYKLKDLATAFISEDAKKHEEAIEEMAKSIGVKLKGEDATPAGWYHLWRAYPEQMETYAKADARFTYDLHTKFAEELGDDESYRLEREVIPILTRAEQRGIRLDPPKVQKLKAEYVALEQETREPLERELGADALGGKGSGDKLIEAIQSLGVPLYRVSKKSGKLETSKWALQEFADDFPILNTLMEWRKYTKFLSTYIAPMDGREVVHTSFKQAEAWTGRMSSAKPNMQNIPKRAGKEAREMFIPREDHAFVVYDYDSIEVRLLAWYMASESYRKLIRDGLDPHAYMAAKIHGGVMEEYTKDCGIEENIKLRNAAKNTMFAITYGAGKPRVADMNGFGRTPEGLARAGDLIRSIKKSLPGYYRLNKRLRAKVEAVGYVNTAFGRKQVVGKDKSYVSLNALIQGTAAQIMKKGLVLVNERIEPLGATPLLLVHDELVTESPLECAEEVSRLMGEALIEALDIDPPLQVEGGIVTTNYADA